MVSQLHCFSASWIDSKLSLKCLDLLTKSVKFASFCRLSGWRTKSWWVLLTMSILTLELTTTWSSMKQDCPTLEITPAWPATLLLGDVVQRQQSLCLVWRQTQQFRISFWLLVNTFYPFFFFFFFFSVTYSAAYVDTESFTTYLFRSTDSFRNKASVCLYGWVTESFTTDSFRNTHSKEKNKWASLILKASELAFVSRIHHWGCFVSEKVTITF